MTETMIEKMARAMWLDDVGIQFAGTAEAEADWDYQRNIYFTHARAALQALREPTEAMINAGAWEIIEPRERSAEGEENSTLTVWQAMIDEALQDGEDDG